MFQIESLRKSLILALLIIVGVAPQRVLAEDYSAPLLLAFSQDGTGIYDPFADYSEFDENSEEEADLNFFRNGRLFTTGIILGYQGFTENMANIYEPAPMFGFYLSYFFDLRFALQLSISSSSNDINFNALGKRIVGSSTLGGYGLSLKYFINTQNITRGLAQFNPYFTCGITQVVLSTKISSDTAVANDNGFGAEMGGGIEFPIMHGSTYIGFQATYKLITFKEIEGSEIVTQQGATGIIPRGDLFNLVAVFGVNF